MVHCIYCWLIGYNVKNTIVFLSLKIDLILTNSGDTDQMPHYAAFHLGPPCICKRMLQRAQASFQQAEAQREGLILHCQWLIKSI